MTISRYIKLSNFLVEKSHSLEISELQFLDHQNQPLLYTITSTIPPTVGSLANLSDGISTINCVFSEANIQKLELIIDFGSELPTFLTGILLGSGTSVNTFPYSFTFSTSTTGTVWVDKNNVLEGYPKQKLFYPGPQTIQTRQSTVTNLNSFNFDLIPTNIKPLKFNGIIKLNSPSSLAGAFPKNCRGLTTGKYYFEIAAPYAEVAVMTNYGNLTVDTDLSSIGVPIVGFYWMSDSLYKRINTVTTAVSYTFRNQITSPYENQPIGVAIDLDNSKLYLIVNNTTIATVLDIPVIQNDGYYLGISSRSYATKIVLNLGESSFANDVPVGFDALKNFNASIIQYENSVIATNTNSVRDLKYRDSDVKPVIGPKTVANTRPMKQNVYFGTPKGYIKGNVYVNTSPVTKVRRLVTLVDLDDSKVIATTYSNAITGEYQFLHLDLGRRYITWSPDPNNVLQPTISGVLIPQKMPVFV